jgi:hypothetical protein
MNIYPYRLRNLISTINEMPGSLKRRGEEADQRLGQLKSLEDDP